MAALAAHPEQMADLIDMLHRRAPDAEPLLDLLGRVAQAAVCVLAGIDGAAVASLLDPSPFTVAHTDARVLAVDDQQYATNGGLCLQAARRGVAVAMTVDQVRRRWPLLAATAHRAGFKSFLAVPVRAGNQCVGVLNLYGAGDAVLTPDPDLLTVLTEYAGQGFTDFTDHQRFAGAVLRQAVSDHKVIGQAISLLVAVHGFSYPYAEAVLHDQAHDWERTPAEQAARIIAAAN